MLETPVRPMEVQVSHKTLWITPWSMEKYEVGDLVKARHWYDNQIGIVFYKKEW